MYSMNQTESETFHHYSHVLHDGYGDHGGQWWSSKSKVPLLSIHTALLLQEIPKLSLAAMNPVPPPQSEDSVTIRELLLLHGWD